MTNDLKSKAWLIKKLNELRKSCSESVVPPDKGYYTAKAQAYKKAIELAELLETYEAPSVDAVEVVHAEWICNPDKNKFSLVCSACGQVMPFVPEYLPNNPPYCNCGAKMGKRRESEVSE